jgi:Uma2 family endonuclease
MSAVIEDAAVELTAVDLVEKFGPIPLRRLRWNHRLGGATETDAVTVHERDGHLCELVQGILVEKVMGQYESLVAAELIYLLKAFLRGKTQGKVFGADGMMKLEPGLIRIPDVSFVSSERLRQNTPTPWQPLVSLVPNIAAEVLSPGNTKQEMDQKLIDYFDAGVQLVWYLDPRKKTATVYTAVDQERTIQSPELLVGDPVLPGLTISLDELFAPANQ